MWIAAAFRSKVNLQLYCIFVLYLVWGENQYLSLLSAKRMFALRRFTVLHPKGGSTFGEQTTVRWKPCCFFMESHEAIRVYSQ